MAVEMCEDCTAQVGGGRHKEPHPNLERVGKKREFTAYGNRADEQDYVCKRCGQGWMHETGNSGYGWMKDA